MNHCDFQLRKKMDSQCNYVFQFISAVLMLTCNYVSTQDIIEDTFNLIQATENGLDEQTPAYSLNIESEIKCAAACSQIGGHKFSFHAGTNRCNIYKETFSVKNIGVDEVYYIKGSCETLNTPWNIAPGENARFLDLHDVKCHDGKGINMFRLSRSNDNISYNYICCRVVNGCNLREIANNFTYDGTGNLNYLDRQKVDCGETSVINQFKLFTNHSGSQWRYEYFCCDRFKALVCYDDSTSFDEDGVGGTEVFYLDRHTIACDFGFLLQSFRLERDPGLTTIRYTFRCCK